MAESWRQELGGGAVGWLGGTYGFTDDDHFIGVVRFDSRESAMANSQRPEQSAWAEKMMGLMDGPVEFQRPNRFRLTYTQPFEQAYMRELFDFAFARAQRGYDWAKQPP
jgi:hypothetical protein